MILIDGLLSKDTAITTLTFKPWLDLFNGTVMTCLVLYSPTSRDPKRYFLSIRIAYVCISLFNCRVLAKLEENAPDQIEVFKTNINTVMKDILGRFKDLQFFTGESMDADGMLAMLEYRDIDGVSTPILMCFKHGLEEEKF